VLLTEYCLLFTVYWHLNFLSRLAPLLVFAGTFLLYLSTLAPGMLRGDSGEFQWAMASLNVAHATGYPLFTLLGHAWQLVPLSPNVAWQLNLLAPFFGALAAATIFLLIRAVTSRGDASLIGALFFALAPVMWFNASILEVYSFHAFLLALLLYLLFRWSQAPEQNTPLYLAFLVLGLAAAHHRLIVLALPAVLVWILLTDRRFLLDVPRLLLCVLLVVPGLLLYAYVPLRLLPEGFSLDFAVNDVILGREYASSLLREINPLPVLLEIPFRNFHIGLLLALLGAVTLFRRHRNLNLALWLVYLFDVVFALIYSVPDIQVFLTSSFVVTAVWIGAGAASLLEWVGARVSAERSPRVQMLLAVILLLSPLFGLAQYPQIQTAVAAEAAPEARARAIAAANITEGALLELDWETATALRFLQTTERLRPDLDVQLIGMNGRDPYWRALQNANAGRAVWIEKGVNWSRAPAGFVTQPGDNDLAQIMRVPVEMTLFDAQVSEDVVLLGYHSTPDAFVAYWRVAKPLTKDLATFVHFLDAKGEKIGQDDRAACCEAVFGYRTSEWQPGQIYVDVFKPAPVGTVSFLLGMYENVNGDIEPYGEEITIK
jgi:4-amino-4-deoxy-L-arabinose transferase-like glycosyltransferase